MLRFFKILPLLLALFYNPVKVSADFDKILQLEHDIRHIYDALNLDNSLEYNVFRYSYIGYLNLKKSLKNKNILTVIDYSLASDTKRFFIIDLQKKKLLYKVLVAHAENTGVKHADMFSNEPDSRKSSLGFYKTGETYFGRHGYSMRLDGLEASNSNARRRAIVLHGADYVSEKYIKKHGMLGRSGGCPAISLSVSTKVIDIIKSGTLIFIYAKNSQYLENSKYLSPDALIK